MAKIWVFFLELFCGTGSLSAAVKKYGVGACTGISSRVTGHTRCPVLPINLGEPTQQPLLWDMLRRDNLCAVHLSPPPSQTGLHSLCADVIEWCHKHGVLVTVEGPASNALWVDGDREARYGQPTEEVSAAPPMPDETAAGESGQPEEEVEDEIPQRRHLLKASGRRLAMWSVVNFLETGKVKLGDREHTFFEWLAGVRDSPLRDCNTEFTPILENLQHMRWAIQQYPHPHHISFDRADDGNGGQCFSTTSLMPTPPWMWKPAAQPHLQHDDLKPRQDHDSLLF